MKLDQATYLRLVALLAAPDEPAMRGKRGHRAVCERDPTRSADEVKRALDVAYVQWRKQDYGQDISCVVSVSVRPVARLRLARRTA